MDETIVCAMMIADDAGNHAFKMVTANEGTQSVGLANLSLETVNFTSEPAYDVYGYAPEGSTVTFNGTAAKFDGNNFHIHLDLPEEVNHFAVEIHDAQGQLLLNGNAIIHSCGTSANFGTPLLDSEFPATLGGTYVKDSYTGIKMNNYIYVLDRDYENGTELPLRIKIADPACVQAVLKNKTTNEEEDLSINKEGYAAFKMKLEGDKADYLLTVKAPANTQKTNITIWNHTAGEDALRWVALDYTVGYWNLQNLFTYVHPSMLQEDGSFRISGYMFNPLQKVTVCGKEAVIDLNTMEWYCDIPLEMGINTVPVYCYSESGYCYDTSVKKIVLSDGPSLNLDLPDLNQNGKYYVQDASFLLQGTVVTELDDATVYINDSQVYGSNNCGHLYGGELAVREFSKELTLEHGDNYITVYAYDGAGFAVKQDLDIYYCPSHEMKDIQEGSWYHEAVDYVLERNLMLGIDNDIFSPNGVATRGQLITVLYRLSGETVDSNAPNPFADVSEGQYYADAVRWGYVKGIVKGISTERFAPEMPISREQAATFLYRYVTLILKQEPATGADLSVFTDGGKVHDYAKEAMAWAVAEGFFQGYGNSTLLPGDNLIRAQMAKLMTILDRDS